MTRYNPRKGRRSGGGPEQLLEGSIQHHGSFAFLLSEKQGVPDAFLRGRSLDLAMDGDRVLARVRPEKNGRPSGEILKVLKRARSTLVGILRRTPAGWALAQEKGTAAPAKVTGFAPGVRPQEGELAVLDIKSWPDGRSPASGIIKEVLGNPSDVSARIDSVLRAGGINEEFPAEVTSQAAAFGTRLPPAAWKGREELFDLPLFTIDGADAKDFDDAVSLEELPGGLLRLGVHIADVANYVKPGSALDREAYARATSVYLPDRVVPMLPPSLSDNLCSLLPHRERLTMSVFMELDRSGNVRKRRLSETVIRSWRRFTYEEVQTLLDGGKVPDVPRKAWAAVKRMGELTDSLYRRRVRRGALDFNLPEYKVNADPHGRPLGVSLRPRLKSHRLVEEFMLLANEAVATELHRAKRPFLHRRHDSPDPLKLKALSAALGDLGITAGHIHGANTARGLQDVIRRAAGHPLEGIINSMVVRSMRQAVYSPVSEGHFGIAARFYSHFTSPIRRYPDLMTHRAVKSLLAGKKEVKGGTPLVKAGEHCSERERAAVTAERKSVDIMRAELLKKMKGEILDGIVTSVTESGAFVSLGETGAEGLLRAGGFKPGARIKVEITEVDTASGKIDLARGDGRPPADRSRWRVSRMKTRGRGKRK